MSRLFFIILFYLFNVAVITTVHAGTHGPIKVFVSILPQKYLVERVGGERITVSVMVKPGLNPETYEPTPKQMADLNDSDLYFRMAVPFESVWIKRISFLNPDLRIIECCGDLVINDPPPFAAVPNAPIIVGGRFNVTNDTTGTTNQFYRLFKP